MTVQQEVKWRYYRHAMIPTTAPHEMLNEVPLKRGSLWKSGGRGILFLHDATDFDCQENTGWWYVIKDTSYDTMGINAKRRYEIKKGSKHFNVRIIKPKNHGEVPNQVQVEVFSTYPLKYRPKFDHDRIIAGLSDWQNGITFAALSKENDSISGYAYVTLHSTGF